MASTSDARAIHTAMYGSTPRNVTSMGVMTAAALIPANPVPSPAPIPAKNVTSMIFSISKKIAPQNIIHYRTIIS